MARYGNIRTTPAWFNLENYALMSDLGAHEWAHEILVRLRIVENKNDADEIRNDIKQFGLLSRQPKHKINVAGEEIYELLHLLSRLLENGGPFVDGSIQKLLARPLPSSSEEEVSKTGSPFLDKRAGVQKLTVHDLLWMARDTARKSNRFRPAALDASFDYEEYVELSHPYDGWSRNIDEALPQTRHLRINLFAPDEIITREFASWLEEERKRPSHFKTPHISDLNTQEWTEFALLPYIDLSLLSIEAKPPTASAMGQALFPNVDIDPGQRIKTVAKKAKAFLAHDVAVALFKLAESKISIGEK